MANVGNNFKYCTVLYYCTLVYSYILTTLTNYTIVLLLTPVRGKPYFLTALLVTVFILTNSAA